MDLRFTIYDLRFRNMASLRLAANGRRLQGRLAESAAFAPEGVRSRGATPKQQSWGELEAKVVGKTWRMVGSKSLRILQNCGTGLVNRK